MGLFRKEEPTEEEFAELEAECDPVDEDDDSAD